MNTISPTLKYLLSRNFQTLLSVAMKPRNYNTLSVSQPSPFISHVLLNRPNKLNALNNEMWLEIQQCFEELSENPDCRVIVLSGSGKLFCAGLDLSDAMKLFQNFGDYSDVAQKCKALEKIIKKYQDSFTAIEKCSKPVIAAVHGGCIGAGVDMISATDIRYCHSDAYFQIKEVDLGMAADVGTLQRLPKIIGCDGLVRELAFTGRKMLAPEALKVGLVNETFNDNEGMWSKALDIAKQIASKSPVAIQGIKLSLNYSRDHTIAEGLEHIKMRNETMLQSEDFINSVTGIMTKETPVFAKL